MRIGTWNLEECPDTDRARGRAIATWLDGQAVDIWLLTEVHRDWDPRGGSFVVSPSRSGSPDVTKRWAGIETRLPAVELRTADDLEHAGEEGLCLARLGDPEQSILVACSVLPWAGVGKYWAGLPEGLSGKFRHVLDHHVARIAAERRSGEPLIWGGDFNQPLTPPYWGASRDGAAALREAFDSFGLVALTEKAEHLNGTSFAIDHLAVSRELASGEEVALVHRPSWERGQLSDHAAYTAQIDSACGSVTGRCDALVDENGE